MKLFEKSLSKVRFKWDRLNGMEGEDRQMIEKGRASFDMGVFGGAFSVAKSAQCPICGKNSHLHGSLWVGCSIRSNLEVCAQRQVCRSSGSDLEFPGGRAR